MTKRIQSFNASTQPVYTTPLSEMAVSVLGADFIDKIHASSEQILKLGIPRPELMAAARVLREDIGGLVRGEMHLARRGGMFIEHTNDPRSSISQIIDCLPFLTRNFFEIDYPTTLDRATDRLVHMIAASYALDYAVMDFRPRDVSESPAREIEGIDELSRKMVLIVGATAVGKDTIRAALIKDIHPNLRISSAVDRETLLKRAEEIGIVVPVKLTGRAPREGERDMTDYIFFDGSAGRPPETKLASLSAEGKLLPYSYQYGGHMYGFALETIPPDVSGKEQPITGLREKLESDSVHMILCGGGTTPEALYFKRIFPNATVVYLLATPAEAGLLAMEQEVVSRWWGRAIGELMLPIHAGVAKLEDAVRTQDSSALSSPEVMRMHDAMPDDLTAHAASVEEQARRRLIEVMTQVGQAVMLCPHAGFTIVPNERGRIEIAVGQIRNVLKQRGVIGEYP
jgi:guanylate kinase